MASVATEGGRKYRCQSVLTSASETVVYAFLIVDAPYHAYGPEDSQMGFAMAYREVAGRGEKRQGWYRRWGRTTARSRDGNRI